MYFKNNVWKSDFKLNGKRYQRTWDTTNKEVAQKCEDDWKVALEANSIYSNNPLGIANNLDWLLDTKSVTVKQDPMKLSEASEWMYERVWQYAEDSKNPPSRIRSLIRFIGDKDILSITDDDILSLKRRMLVEGIDGKTYKDKTFNHIIGALRTTMDMLESTKTLVFYNKPSFKNIYAPANSSRIVCFSETELISMNKYFKDRAETTKYFRDVEMHEYFIINSNLGLRPSEFYELRVGDINFEENTITISRAKKNNTTRVDVGGTKNGLSRTLPIGGIVLETLKNIVEKIKISKSITKREAMDRYLQDTEGTTKDFYYWVSKGAYDNFKDIELAKCPITHLTQKFCEIRWKDMLKELGFSSRSNAEEYTQYALRHTVASRLVSIKKFSAHKLMMFLGHTNIQTSLKYVHLNAEDIRDAVGVGVDY